MSRETLLRTIVVIAVITGVFAISNFSEVRGQGPTLVDRNLVVRAVATGLDTPTAFAFIGPADVLLLEKQTGRVIRVSAVT